MEIGADRAAIVIPESSTFGAPDEKPEARRTNAVMTSEPAADKSNQNRSNPTCKAQSEGGMVK